MPDSTNWRAKLHPAFFELAEMNKVFERRHREISSRRERQVAGLGKKDLEKKREIDGRAIAEFNKLLEWCGSELMRVQERHPNMSFNERAYSYLHPAADEPDTADPFTRYLHWMRHRKSLTMTALDIARGSLTAVNHLARTVQDRLRVLVRREKLKPFQGNEPHRQFLELMICFERQPLTPQERADCADAYCGCELVEHDMDALRKQYGRLSKELNAAYAAAKGPDDPDAK